MENDLQQNENLKASSKNKTVLITIIVVVIFIGAVIVGSENGNNVKVETNQAAQQSANVAPAQKQETQPVQQADKKSAEVAKVDDTNPVSKIESVIKSVGDYEVTVWDSKQNLAKATTPPPYEILVNVGDGKIASCYYAKNVMFEVMKKIYSDASIKDKISRVKFTSWGQLKVSLGSEDGAKMDWSPAAAGPTLFWKTLMKFKPYEDETGALSARTWGQAIGSDCD